MVRFQNLLPDFLNCQFGCVDLPTIHHRIIAVIKGIIPAILAGLDSKIALATQLPCALLVLCLDFRIGGRAGALHHLAELTDVIDVSVLAQIKMIVVQMLDPCRVTVAIGTVNLNHTMIRHPAERKERAERPELKKVDYAAGDVKHQIGNTVKAACYGYRFQSFGEYKALLAAYNVCAEEVKGEINGKPYQGIVYSAMNDKGEKIGNPVKASRIGKSVGYEAVQRRMEKSGEAIKNGKLKERTRKIVATAMQTARSRKELEQQLKKQGIDVVFRQNDSGRIYGVTFIDHDSRVVLNGSRLGKEYSANVFNERFSGETGKIHQPEMSAPQQDQPTHQEQPGFMPKSDIVSGVASVLGAFGGLLGGGASGGDDPQDTARQKRKKKKKRTRRID